MITREEVLALLDYDEFTGVFTWKVGRSCVKSGAEAGTVDVNVSGKTYRYIAINGRKYLAHRLVWLVLTGKFPDAEIDHLDGNGLNNRAANLRPATRSENARNMRRQVRNTSGTTGVYWNKSCAKWQASIRLNGWNKYLGLFESFDEAVIVRKESEKLHGFSPNHGSTRPL